MIFELAKRVGLRRKFREGDIETSYEHELPPSGVTLAQLKRFAGGISALGKLF